MSNQLQIQTIVSVLSDDAEMAMALSPSTIEYLYRNKLLNNRAIEQEVIRREVARLYAGGMRRCDAMVKVADMVGCSYEKVRALVYQKN